MKYVFLELFNVLNSTIMYEQDKRKALLSILVISAGITEMHKIPPKIASFRAKIRSEGFQNMKQGCKPLHRDVQ
jgi:hypothetical protein